LSFQADQWDLTGRVIVRGDREYYAARKDTNLRINKFPYIIVFAQNTQDVINAICWARRYGIPIRARSGRHNYEGFSLDNDGIIIDVSEMKQIVIDKCGQVATVQAGITNIELYGTLAQKGLAFCGGTCGDVGVSGLILGGGHGLLMRAKGLACDNLISLEMVNAAGRVVRADAQKNPDLLWACRGGGGGNFGIVTSLTLKVFPLSTVTVFDIVWDFSELKAVIDMWQRLFPFTTEKLTAELILFSRKSGLPVEATGMFLGTEANLRRILEPMLSVGTPIVRKIQTVPFIEAVKQVSAQVPIKGSFKGTGAFAMKLLPASAINTLYTFLESVQTENFVVTLSSHGGTIQRLDPQDTAYFYRNALMFMEYDAFWEESGEAKAQIYRVEGIRNLLHPFAPGAYINAPDICIKDYARAYYGENLPRLSEVKSKYDPENVFCFAQSIPPA